MILNKGIRIGGNLQDFSLSKTIRDSWGVFAQNYLGYVRVPFIFEQVFEDPADPSWEVYFLDRIIDWSVEWGVPVLFMLESVPTNNAAWQTLAGHVGVDLTNRDGSEFPSDNRFVRPEEALYPTIRNCNDTFIERACQRYISNGKTPSEWMAIQWWNEPWFNDGTEPAEFNIMSNALVPRLRTKCDEYDLELWSPPLGGGQGEVSFETARTNEIARVTLEGTNDIFDPSLSPTHWQYYDALTFHAPYIHLGLYPYISGYDAGMESAKKTAAIVDQSRARLLSLGYNFYNKEAHATEGGFGYDYFGVASQGRVMGDQKRGWFIRMQAEHNLRVLDTYCIYLLGNANTDQDYPGSGDTHQWGIINGAGQWTKASASIASASGSDPYDDPLDIGAPTGYDSDARGGELEVQWGVFSVK